MEGIKITPVDKWIINPVNSFISKSSTGGIVLMISTLLAIILANSPLSHWYHELWEHRIAISFGGEPFVDMTLHHWINDGLMAVFFFVIGLELKREIVAGELSNPKNAILPITAGVGGMVFPALIFTGFNMGLETMNGWGIPMATDLAFALGILYLLGDRVPASLKIFLTAFAIVDDLGSVLVIALFYTSEISFMHLGIGVGALLILVVGNFIGVRSNWFYGLIGIGGVWLFFLLSGVHATIAAILTAFTIPATVKISESAFIRKMTNYLDKFRKADPDHDVPTLTPDQLHILDDMETCTQRAMTPLQKLEHEMHPLVAFIVMPIFAIANAGVTFGDSLVDAIASPVAFGVMFGLFFGKIIGIFGVPTLLMKLRIVPPLEGVTTRHMLGMGFIASIGFTMSLFINELAYKPLGAVGQEYISHAKIAIIFVSLIGGITGYMILKGAKRSPLAN